MFPCGRKLTCKSVSSSAYDEPFDWDIDFGEITKDEIDKLLVLVLPNEVDE
jgi:hypothetical protein